ncbi:amidohydrolase [Lutibacter sp.]|uniref:amidohydrolase n=1 Tax=Lutibacter sp. TaxID=1925666 RepID=UPI001A30E4FB|nr:amidohydrolase [Lutibacter sp.]MBI9039772.1 amidohydrolase [Lutibacter sp.]
MNRFLNIVLIQSDIIWQKNAENLINYSKKINAISEEADLIILPEMFTTGFSMKPKDIAESMEGNTIAWMVETAKKRNAAIAGSAIIEEEGKFYNRFLFVHPSGEINYYNKRHLFTLAGEEKVYTAGENKIIINYKGWKICPLVCYDLRFPVWSRNVDEYDILLYVANWPKPRISAWDILLSARAIENICYSIGVNRVGVDAGRLEYNGHSAVYNCLGEQLINALPNREDVVSITIDKTHITATRIKLNFLKDKDTFKIL